jgi:large subunit ribosomal protein L18
MAAKKSRERAREIRKSRVRRTVRGTDSRPRLSVYRSLRFTYAQLISDDTGAVLGAASTQNVKADGKSAQSIESAKALGAKIAEVAKSKNIESVIFDRNGYLYHGRVKAVAEGAREAGLSF